MKLKIRRSGRKRKKATGFRKRSKTKSGKKILARQRRKKKRKSK